MGLSIKHFLKVGIGKMENQPRQAVPGLGNKGYHFIMLHTEGKNHKLPKITETKSTNRPKMVRLMSKIREGNGTPLHGRRSLVGCSPWGR